MNKGTLLATALISALTASGCGSSEDTTETKSGALVKCEGINECKGTSECASEGTNSCEGMNECAGHGWITVPEAQCEEEGGSVLEET
jgi:uncharacterized membrane protein